MSNNSWNQTLVNLGAAGPTLTAAAAASMLVAASPAAGQQKFTIPAGLLKLADKLRVRASGIISCVVTTPGTARIDLRMGSVVVFDTGALNLNVVAKTNVPWWLDVDLSVRFIGAGTIAQLWGQGIFASEAVIGSPLPSAGGNGVLNVPVSGLALSTGFDSTVSNVFDSFFTQTVATGSFTCEQFELIYGT
jgi:hypothetical protein